MSNVLKASNEESPDIDFDDPEMNPAANVRRDEASPTPSPLAAPPPLPYEYSSDLELAADEHRIRPDALSQYCITDHGYKATTTTIKRLPAGVYACAYDQKLGPFFQPKAVITDKLVKFPDSRSDMLLGEIDTFWGLKEHYKSFGLSHKRGMLLWGPPGSGKTSTIAMAIEDMVKRGGIVLLAEAPAFLKVLLREARNVEPERPITVIWEDLDAVIKRYNEAEVLEILDGESQVSGVVFIATTNYPEDLDSRIVNRPSRFDRVEFIGMPSAEARGLYLQAKVKTTVAPDGTDLVAQTEGMSVAHLRELVAAIWCFGHKPLEVIQRLRKMEQVPHSERQPGKKNKTGFGG